MREPIEPWTLIRVATHRVVVCRVHDQARVQGVYLDLQGRAMAEDFVFDGLAWHWANIDGPCISADRTDWMQPFAEILRLRIRRL